MDALRALLRPVRRRFGPSPEIDVPDDPNLHPERLALLPYVTGRCLEIGCGHRKTHPDVLGVDLTPGGSPGAVGNVTGQTSQADIAADGGLLPFADGVFDSLIARHNLEHYVDTAGTLIEWARVLRPGGVLAVVLPDEEAYPGRTLELDPTHYHGYSPSALARLVELTGLFTDVVTDRVVPEWSFMLTAKRVRARRRPEVSAPIAGRR